MSPVSSDTTSEWLQLSPAAVDEEFE